MTTHTTPSQYFALAVGAALIGIDTWMNTEFMYDLEKAITSLVVAIPVASVASAASLPFMERSWRSRQFFKAFGLFGLFVILASFSFSASVDRSGSSRDAAIDGKQGENLAFNRATTELNEALADRKKSQADMAREFEPICNKNPKRCPNWRTAKGLTETATLRIREARSRLNTVKAPQTVDSMSKRLAALLPMSEKQIATYQPLLLPLALQLGGLLFVWFGTSSAPAPKPRPRRKNDVNSLSKKDQVLYWHQYMLDLDGKTPSRQWLQEKVGCHKATISRALAEPA